MTPLAFDLLKDLTTPGAFRVAKADIRSARLWAWRILHHCKFFDLVAAEELVIEASVRMLTAFAESDGQRFNARLAFLPAPSTWLEFHGGDHNQVAARYAMVLHGSDSVSECSFAILERYKTGEWFRLDLGNNGNRLPLIGSGSKPLLYEKDGITPSTALPAHFHAYAALALINSPRIIGQRQHMPHERIEREKLKSLGLVGKFPLRAWTEIVLKIALPIDRTGEPSTEAHLTGEKCLHYCRTHLRWCDGRLEYRPVEGHWRGNPALGIKRARYRVESNPVE